RSTRPFFPFVFFLQAEDGIRDDLVTGVQTCALPIWQRAISNFADLALFISFFPPLVAGPIVRATTFLPQLVSARKFADVDVRAAVLLFLSGFIKKACIADGVAPIADRYFAHPANFTPRSAWIGVLFYAIQIYCDFSGYTAIAIAAARLLWYPLVI